MAGHPYSDAPLQMSHPGLGLSLRNLCRPGDTPGFRPHPSRNSQWAFPGAGKFHPQHQTHAGDGFHPTPDQWLADLKPDTLIAFFGYNESFDGPAGIANFKGELDAWIKHTQAQKYNGKAAPRIVLVSPIAYENLSKSRDLPDGRSENSNLALYTQAMAEVAKATGVEFVDVYKPTHDLYPTLKKPFTRNGFLPNDDGYRLLSEMLVKAIYGDAPVKTKASPKDVLAAIADKEWFWSNDFSMLNGVHVDGRRYNPFGPQNYPDEKKKIRQMTDLRDQATWAMVSGKSFDLAAADKATHPLPPVDTNYNNGTTEYKYGEEAEKTITTPEGYQAKLFASEKEFPNLANPMQISFDNKGRLWVATMPTYPHYRPGDPLPDDKLLIYEDTNGDGKADKETVFADKLHLPIGFEFVPGGVYISQEPHLVFLGDTDGDDKADVREVVLTGFDSHDTHHAISAYAADPSGAFMMCEGIFLHSNVETPYGPVRGVDGGFPNPWGFAFDDWGQDFLIHTSGPTWNWALPVSLNPISYGAQAPATADLVPGGQSVRPTSGLEFVSSRHFPDEVQGDALIGNCIGFLGLKQHSIVEDGTGYKTGFRHELMKSSDGNFRPADFEFAPDGSLYVIDWHNVLIGHMQHNARDPLRDHVHGRIYRITYPARPLVKPATVDGAPIATLLENLKLPEYRTRYRSRRELREHPVDQVIPAVQKWVASLDANDPNNAHQQLEALWVTWGMNAVDTDLLRKLIIHSDHRVRCATVRVLRYNFDKFSDTLDLLKKAASDDHGRVRLEAVVAATWYNKSEALEVVNIAQGKGADGWSQKPIEAATARLQGKVEKKETENPLPPIPEYLTSAEKEAFKAGHEVYFRDGHCATCHQKDGKGLDPAFPPLHDSIFVHGSPERLIKLTLHGVMGPFELHGKKYDGQVPMTPFGGIINDKEMAAVLTYVRNTYGNKASAITPEQVAKVRKATKDMKGFYQMDALLKEHPLEK
jgi:mono/diheme cytochrome c family protein/glucose/arabinose dehydrogenase